MYDYRTIVFSMLYTHAQLSTHLGAHNLDDGFYNVHLLPLLITSLNLQCH